MFIRYNQAAKIWEYDSSPGQVGAGPWVRLPIDYSQIVNAPGPTPLPPNIAYKDQANIFTQDQTISKGGALFALNDTSAPVNQKHWNFQLYNGDLYIQSRNDAGVPIVNALKIFKVTGSLAERGRGAPIGDWETYPAVLSSTGAQPNNYFIAGSYTLIGSTCHFKVRVAFGSTSSFGSGAYRVSLPLTVEGTWIAGYTPGAYVMLYKSGVRVEPAVASIVSSSTIAIRTLTGSEVAPTVPWAWADNDEIGIFGTYRIS